jgi:hypothetical protein
VFAERNERGRKKRKKPITVPRGLSSLFVSFGYFLDVSNAWMFCGPRTPSDRILHLRCVHCGKSRQDSAFPGESLGTSGCGGVGRPAPSRRLQRAVGQGDQPLRHRLPRLGPSETRAYGGGGQFAFAPVLLLVLVCLPHRGPQVADLDRQLDRHAA